MYRIADSVRIATDVLRVITCSLKAAAEGSTGAWVRGPRRRGRGAVVSSR